MSRTHVAILPIEPDPERYAAQWFDWWRDGLVKAGWETARVCGDLSRSYERKRGEWLDPIQTWQWKGEQIATLAEKWDKLPTDCVVLALDGWGPAAEAFGYMRAVTGRIDLRLVLYMHAGTYDHADYLFRIGMEDWAQHSERGWMECADMLLVGSAFHRDLLYDSRDIDKAKVQVVGCPVTIPDETIEVPWQSRNGLIFPHRIAPEKRPDIWKRITQLQIPSVRCETTRVLQSDGTYAPRSKDDYYRALASARVVFSAAEQETFGIAMQEGMLAGCYPVAPRRVSYPELIPDEWLYETEQEAAELVEKALAMDEPYSGGASSLCTDCISLAGAAMRTMP